MRNTEQLTRLPESVNMLSQFEMFAVEAARHLKGGGRLHDTEIVDRQLRLGLGHEFAVEVNRSHFVPTKHVVTCLSCLFSFTLSLAVSHCVCETNGPTWME